MALPARIVETNRVYTTEEFMALPLDNTKPYELVRGVIKEMSHPGREHMFIMDNLYGTLRNYVRANRLGRILPPGSFELQIPGAIKDTVRSPDLAFLPSAKLDGPPGAITDAPDLAIEIYSPNDRPGDLRDKLEDYQAAGWNLVWVIYPPTATPKKKAATVEIYRLQQSLNPVQVLGKSEILSGEDIIPGFTMPIADLFDYGD